MALFAGVMTMSVYAVTRLSGGGFVAACTAALFLSAYPVLSWLSHTFFLDMPATAMTALALVSLLWWRRSASPRWRWTLICSSVLAAACLTKQVVAVYLLPVGCYFVFVDLIVFSIQRGTLEAKVRFTWLVHAIAMAIFTFLIGLPFLATNFQWNVERVRHNVQAISDLGARHIWVNGLETYLRELPAVMSPAFLLLFVVAVFSVGKQVYRRVIPVIVSAIGGPCLLSALPSEVQDERYLGPFLLGAAVFSGLFLERLIVSDTIWRKIAGKAILALAVFKFVNYNFAPSLIPLAPLRWPFALSEHNGNPQQHADWGYSFILATIQSLDGNKPVYLNFVPNHDVIHVNGLSLYLREKGVYSILPTTPRVWTIVGDRVRFDETKAGYPMWYLTKTGDNGLGLCDQQSRDDYEKLIAFIRDGW